MSAAALKRDSINEHLMLKESVQSNISEIQKLKNDIDLLNQDRKFYYDENLTLKDDNARLQASVTRLELANERYKALLQQTNEKLQRTQTDQMAAVHTIRSMSQVAEQDKEFRTRFNLPEGEFSIIAYSCANDSFQSGTLHICPFHICFDPSALANAFAKENPIWTLPIRDIVSLNKVKVIKFLPGKGTCVEIRTKDGGLRFLKGFLSRKECLRNIYNQALTIGHKIDMLRENLPDQEHAEPITAAKDQQASSQKNETMTKTQLED
ncbi:hypothetical protein SAMD00019534_056130, partial [Acytostelium subglobosum LB1]|uniref:hypothetical protein n=1 Tax=Acytostelium subglobosum LB1 TaxID=1410327 RepID=UPI000644A1FE